MTTSAALLLLRELQSRKKNCRLANVCNFFWITWCKASAECRAYWKLRDSACTFMRDSIVKSLSGVCMQTLQWRVSMHWVYTKRTTVQKGSSVCPRIPYVLIRSGNAAHKQPKLCYPACVLNPAISLYSQFSFFRICFSFCQSWTSSFFLLSK